MPEPDDDFEITHTTVSPDDPIVHGRRWRQERDAAREVLQAIVLDPNVGYLDVRLQDRIVRTLRDGASNVASR